MGKKPKIVVIDDNEVVLEVTRGALEGAGFDVVTHDRPVGCVALILHEKPDLVLMDVSMPGLGGDTVVAMLSKAAPTSETIVLLHSSLSAEVLRAKATSAGAHGYLQKSGDMFGLTREIHRWLKRTSSGRLRAAPVVPSDEQPNPARRPSADGTSAPGESDSQRELPAARRSSGTLRIDAPTVLLVDGDMGVLSTFRRHLQPEDLSVEFALSGAQALRRLRSDQPPHVVICDALLADTQALEVYEGALVAEPSYRRRFIFTTSPTSPSAVTTFLDSFSGPILVKPVEQAALVRAVRSCLYGAAPFSKSSSRA